LAADSAAGWPADWSRDPLTVPKAVLSACCLPCWATVPRLGARGGGAPLCRPAGLLVTLSLGHLLSCRDCRRAWGCCGVGRRVWLNAGLRLYCRISIYGLHGVVCCTCLF